VRPVPLLALAALLLARAAFAASPRFVDYLYIEANEGGSSGGHAAIRFGDEVYHFQHERPGVLRLHRDDWRHFRYAYAVLENRTMHTSRVAVAEATYARLREEFSERYLSERRVFEQRDVLCDDRMLLEVLLARQRGGTGATLRIRGGGFFFPEDGRSGPSAAALALRMHVLETYGPDAIGQRAAEIRAELARLAPASDDPATIDVAAPGFPHFPRTFSTRYRDLLTALLALRALDDALPLRRDAYWSPTDAGLQLEATERRALDAYADRLTGELTRLLRSARPDWGFAFLAGMARLEALRASGETGRLVLLDAFPPESEVMPRSSVRQRREAVLDLRAEADDEFMRTRARIQGGETVDEATFAALEAAGNRFLELDAAITQDRALRVPSGPLLPSRDAPWSDLIVPHLPSDDLVRSVAQARAAEEGFARRLQDRYGYNLITRNCVSEIFRTVSAAGADLGWHVDTGWSLDFIPFVSARTVNATWNVVQQSTIRSYRRSRLDDMVGGDNAFRVRLRESNVVTSTIYRRNADDSFFVLFTDDVVPLRPLFGTVNLAAALGAVAAGLPLLPVDHGHTLWSGVRGALFSLPELAFVSLRKGSFDYVPRDRRPRDTGAEIFAGAASAERRWPAGVTTFTRRPPARTGA